MLSMASISHIMPFFQIIHSGEVILVSFWDISLILVILGNNHHELQTIHHPRINHLYHLLKGWIVKGLYKIFCNNPNNYEGIVKGLYHLLFGRISHIYTICLKGWIVKGLYKIFSWEE